MEIITETTTTKKLAKDKLAEKFAPYSFDTHIEEKIRELLTKKNITLGQVLFLIETLWSKINYSKRNPE